MNVDVLCRLEIGLKLWFLVQRGGSCAEKARATRRLYVNHTLYISISQAGKETKLWCQRIVTIQVFHYLLPPTGALLSAQRIVSGYCRAAAYMVQISIEED